MRKLASIVVILGLILLASMIESAIAVNPPNPPASGVGQAGPMQIVLENGDGGPVTLDPAVCYDTASAEVIFNVYDTLIQFDGEHMDNYIGILVDRWNLTQLAPGTMSPEGLTWYYRYYFHLRNWANMTFAPPFDNYTVTAADIEYSFERTMVLDPPGGPQWMLTEPLLNDAGGAADLLNTYSVSTVGNMIDHSIGISPDNQWIWFNIGFPSSYPPFMQTLCQTWSSILSMQFINNQIIAEEGINDWSGNWMANGGDHTDWINQHGVYTDTGPLDIPAPDVHKMCGSGPFQLQTWNTYAGFWLVTRHVTYWQGWPAPWPYMASVGPAGYVDSIKEYFNILDTGVRVYDLLNGAADMVAIPRSAMGQLYKSPIPPYGPPTNYPADGIRCIPNLPTLQVEVLAFTFNISPSTPYGPVHGAGDWSDPGGIPSDFFGNPNWGLHMRKAFAYAIDYVYYYNVGWLGEAQVHDFNTNLPPCWTVFIPTLPWIALVNHGYTYNLASAWTEIQVAVAAGATTSWTIPCLYNLPAGPRQLAAFEVKAGFDALNAAHGTNMIINPIGILSGDLLSAASSHQAPIYAIGWQADYPDPHDFAMQFLASTGTYSIWDGYSNSTIDALVAQGMATPNGPARTAVYTALQEASLADIPVIPLAMPLGRHFERDWLAGWYYNPIYPGVFGYNLWKWYYLPQVNQNAPNPPTQPLSDQLGADVNYDGIINMKDVGTVARSFGHLAGPPIDSRWVFRCDTNLDRLINMKDIGYVARNFDAVLHSDTWIATGHDPAIVSIVASSLYANQGDTVTLTVVAKNLGVVDDAFTVAVDCNGIVMEKRFTPVLGPGATAIMTFSWDTTGATEGVYVVTATAIAFGDPNPSNNRLSTTVALFIPTFNQIDFVLDGVSTLDSDWGAVDLIFPGYAAILYLNLNSSGTWSIQNLPILSIEGDYVIQTQRFWFPIGVPSGTDVTSIVYGITITDHVLAAAPAEARSATVGSVGYEIYNGGEDVALHTAPAPAEAVVGGMVADPVQHKKQGVPNQEAGVNECVPTAVSNSVQFLNDKHSLGIDPSELTIDKMKTATQWKVPPRTTACYIWHDDSRPEGARNAWWEDKDAYMQAHNLPITTKMVLPKDIGTLIAEIDACQDIEAELNGHTVCVVGMADLGHGSYSVTISHDSNQTQNPGGCITETGVWHSDTGTWSGDLAGYGLNYFIVECPKK